MPQLPASTPAPVVVLDASVWLSRVLLTDVNRSLARAWINKYIDSGGSFVAPTLFAVEVAATVRRVTQRQPYARKALNELMAFTYMRLLPMDQDLVNEASEIAIAHGIKGADSIYVALAVQLGIPLVTFDKEQLTRAAGIVRAVRP